MNKQLPRRIWDRIQVNRLETGEGGSRDPLVKTFVNPVQNRCNQSAHYENFWIFKTNGSIGISEIFQ